MFCPSCGAALPDGSRFCTGCGASTDRASMPLTRTRPALVTVLAVLKIFAGVFWLGATGLLLLASATEEFGVVFACVAAVTFGITVLCAACAYGLWTLRSYGRVLQIVLSFAGILIHFPFGSVISILILIYLFTPGIRILFSGRAPESLSREEAELLRSSQRLGKTTAIVVVAAVAVLIVPMTGMTAAIAIPNFLNAVDRGKQKRTMADVRTISQAMEAYAKDQDGYPVADSAEALAGVLAPKYVRVMPQLDGWSHSFQVSSTASSYTIYSQGKDGSGSSCEPAETTTFNDEICLTNGQFVRYPAGTQQ